MKRGEQIEQHKKTPHFFHYTQKQFAQLVGVPEDTVSQWENGSQEFSYDALRDMSLIFHISPDFVRGSGIFSQWEQTCDYYDAVSAKLSDLIPDRLEMPTFCPDKYLSVWLDTRLYPPYKDEIELARWFSFAIQDIQITPTGKDPDGNKTADVEVVFTPEFAALIGAEEERCTTISGERKPPSIMQVACRDGSFYVKELTDEQTKYYKMELDNLKPIDDEKG